MQPLPLCRCKKPQRNEELIARAIEAAWKRDGAIFLKAWALAAPSMTSILVFPGSGIASLQFCCSTLLYSQCHAGLTLLYHFSEVLLASELAWGSMHQLLFAL